MSVQAPAEAQLRARVLELAAEHARLAHAAAPFIPGKTPVLVSGRVFGPEDVAMLVDSSLDFWLTTGRYNDRFEKELGGFLGQSRVLTCNSGSSANLLAVAALTSPKLGDRALKAGDEAVTVAAGFPTTVNPLLHFGLTPVFVDVLLPSYNADLDALEAAIGPKTKVVILAHTLGNPFDLDRVKALAEKHRLWFIEDCCDALGSTFKGRPVGSAGDIGTLSFFPAHHITMGEGGAVFTNNPRLKPLLESFRDWGRDCWCAPGKDDTCGKRFQWKLGDLPEGYDHKYTYSHAGFNLKITDMQAAVGVAQLQRLPGFIAARKANFRRLRAALAPLEHALILPEAAPGSDPSWFGFPITVRDDAGFTRADLIRALEKDKIATRLLFAGNLTRQPYFRGRAFRVHGALTNTDRITTGTFWLGVYPGLTAEMIDFVAERVTAFVRGKAS
ncbi:MAG: lipopolysaccharide biosynthesis protein RfbH [Elusimicrobiota bacterium]